MSAKELSLRNRFKSFILSRMTNTSQFDNPMALFQWFLQEWGRPLKPAAMQQAYIAAWAVSIDKGMVKL